MLGDPSDLSKPLESVFKNVVDWVKFAEAKNAALIALCGAILSNLFKPLLDGTMPCGFWVRLYVYELVGLTIVSLLLALLSFVPQTRIHWMFGRLTSSSRNNVIFYGEIRNHTADDYLHALSKSVGIEHAEFSDFEKDYANQIVVNSTIAYKKFNFFRIGIWVVIGGIVTLPLGILLYALIDPNSSAYAWSKRLISARKRKT